MSNYRNILKLANSGGHLRTEDHVYVLPDGAEFGLSVTDIVEHHFPFDREEVAERLAKYAPKYEGMTKEDILDEWDDIRDHGTVVHDQISAYIDENIMPSESKAMSAVKWYEPTCSQVTKVFPKLQSMIETLV